MSGNRFILDTNAIVALLSGSPELESLLRGASWIGISVVSSIEYLSYRGLTPSDILLYNDFESMISVCDLMRSNTSLIGRIAELRSSAALKLPDCIIAATAIENQSTLITRDIKLLNCKAIQTATW